MAKKIKFESFKYRFLIEAEKVKNLRNYNSEISWSNFLKSLQFIYAGNLVEIRWECPQYGVEVFAMEDAKFYTRGDTDKQISNQKNMGLLQGEDRIKIANKNFFFDAIMKVGKSAGYKENIMNQTKDDVRLDKERQFHDDWANSEDVEKIDVRATNEVCTAPEMRCITRQLGDIRGKSLLDVGCGLGEASVYFALQGAEVTSSDLSQGMLDATMRLAKANGTQVKLHIASAENMQLSTDQKFDIIYAGNLLHHVNIEETLVRIKPHLATDGIFVSWDPLAYNPAINLYRKIATNVRTPDEHPLKLQDIKLFKKHFNKVETHYFWLTTLIIFVIMALAQRRDPNKERFWKVILTEGNKWKWLYQPLAIFDKLLLKLIPPLRLLCWNVVIIAK